MRKPSARSLVTVGAVVLALVAAGSVGAVADRLVTSRDIKNGTIKRVDLSKNVSKALDKKGARGPRGKQGPVGATGLTGLPGPKGATGPRGRRGFAGEAVGKISSWTVTFTADGTQTGLTPGGDPVALGTSTQTIPGFTAIQGLDVQLVSGDFSTCTTGHGLSMTATTPTGGATLASWEAGADPVVSRVVYRSPVHLTFGATCSGDGATPADRIRPLPTFTVKFIFGSTALSTTPTVTFN